MDIKHEQYKMYYFVMGCNWHFHTLKKKKKNFQRPGKKLTRKQACTNYKMCLRSIYIQPHACTWAHTCTHMRVHAYGMHDIG